MTKAIRSACAWLLALVMPFHALTSLYLDWRGPSHVHQDAGAGHVHQRASKHGHYAHVHEHVLPERHHHPAGDSTVVGVETGTATQAVVVPTGWSSTMVAAIVSATSDFCLMLASSTRHPKQQSVAVIPLFSRLERPPRTSLA